MSAPTIEELEERARQRAEAKAKARDEQYLKDLLAKEALEDRYDALATVKVSRFVTGQPTFAVVKMPTPEQYKRYKDQVAKTAKKETAAGAIDATDLIGKACWVYPAPTENGIFSDAQKSMSEEFPGIVTTLGNAAIALADGRATDEGKG